MAGIKGAPGSVLFALQEQREQDKLANEIRKRQRLEGGLPPTGAGQRESKALTIATIETLQPALTTLDHGVASAPLTPPIAELLLGKLQNSTANQYTALISKLHAWCAAQGLAGNLQSPSVCSRARPPQPSRPAYYVLS